MANLMLLKVDTRDYTRRDLEPEIDSYRSYEIGNQWYDATAGRAWRKMWHIVFPPGQNGFFCYNPLLWLPFINQPD